MTTYRYCGASWTSSRHLACHKYFHGNHDYDTTSDAHSTDSWRHIHGSALPHFEIGDAVFVALDKVVRPRDPEDDGPGGRDACAELRQTFYEGSVPDDQRT